MAIDLSAPKTTHRPAAVLPPQSNNSPNFMGWAALAVVVAAFLPLAIEHGSRLWEKPHYQFFPFVLLGSGVLAWSRWPKGALTPGDDTRAMFGLITGLAFLLVAEVVFSPSLSVVGGLTFLLAGTYRMGGWSLCRAMLPAWLFLWIILPLPLGLDRTLVMSMQTVTSKLSSFVLDYLGIIHVLEGNVIEIPSHRLLVEEACAGVNSLFSILACSVFLILFLRRPWFRAGVLLISSLGWVIVANVIRVVAIALARAWFDFDLSEGTYHQLLGLFCFGLAVLLIWSTDRLLLFFAPRLANDRIAPQEKSSDAPAVPARSFCPIPLAAVFLLPLVFHFVIHGAFAKGAYGSRDVLKTMANIKEETLPKEFDGWTLVKYDEPKRTMASSFGEYSKLWHYKRGNLTAAISLDYPFAEFHGLWECYQGQGWSIEEKGHRNDKNRADRPEYWFEVRFARPGLHSGYLTFSEFNPHNESLPFEGRWAQTFHRYERALNAWREWSTKSEPTPEKLRGPAYQIQMFVDSLGPLTEQEREDTQALYFHALTKLRNELFPADKK